MSVNGGSAILGPSESGILTADIQSWCPGKPGGLELMHRASRHGWCSTNLNNAKCDLPIIILFQIGRGRTTSVVGGYSGVPVSESGYSSGAFLFMLKDGQSSRSTKFKPVKWDKFRDGNGYYSTTSTSQLTGENDLQVERSRGGGTNMLLKGRDIQENYGTPHGSAILALLGHTVSEMEVFRVHAKAVETTSTEKAVVDDAQAQQAPPVMPVPVNDEVGTFGALVAGSLMEECMALHQAKVELAGAAARATACANSLAAVYGADIAAGKEDQVIELSVRGTRMTTLRSTLQVCHESALAARFDEDKWPATEKGLDDHGRQVVDCSPTVFFKILDVLRMRKREAWDGRNNKKGKLPGQKVFVVIKAGDRTAFEKFVNMYFPGCESFVMDYVDFLKESKAPR